MADDGRATHPLEVALADSQPFGDCDYIWERLCLQYRRRVEMLGEYSDHARRFLSALDDAPVEQHRRILGDPVVRATIDGSLSHLKMGGEPFPADELRSVFRIAAANLRTASTLPPLAVGTEDYLRASDGPWPWIWSEKRVDDDTLGGSFQRLFSRYHQGLVLSTPDSRTREMLLEGIKLTQTLCPRLSPSAMSHVHLIAVVVASRSARFTSMTNPRVPGTIFLSPSVLNNPWQAAEILLHEAMHVKFIDLEHTHSLLSEDYDAGSSPTIRPHWNRAQLGNVNEWPVSRALTVLHVYTCLALFFAAVADRSSSLEAQYGPLHGVDPAKQARRSLDRAHYLAQQLEQHEECLGFAGRLFVSWLGRILRWFDPVPPPEGSYLHLVLDLYEREADELRAFVALPGGDAPRDDAQWAASIREVARCEISSTLVALSMIAESSTRSVSGTLQRHTAELAALENAKASFGDSADEFLAVRSSVSEAFRLAMTTAHSSSPPSDDGEKAPADVMREMVEDSGVHLNTLLAALA